MKRSAQVALVLMGVTGTTAAGAYMMPPRPECRATPAPVAAPAQPTPSALTGATPAEAPQPCRRRSWGPWNWSSNSSRYYSYDNRKSSSPRSWFPSTRSPTPSTSIAPTTSPRTSTGIRTSTPSTPRSGFGTTGRSMSPGS